MKKWCSASLFLLISLTAPTNTWGSAGELLLYKIRNPSPLNESGDFGGTLATMGNSVIVAAKFSDVQQDRAGVAYRFDGANGNLLTTFHNPQPDHYRFFGMDVLGLGGEVVVSTTSLGTDGAAYVFDANTGQLLQSIYNPEAIRNEASAWSTSLASLDGDLVVGYGDPTSGVAHRFNVNTGALAATFRNPTPESGPDAFGHAVAVSSSQVVVGAFRDGPIDAGGAYVFEGGNGELLRTLANPTPTGNEQFGRSIAVLGDLIAIGVPFDDATGVRAGGVYVFDRESGQLVASIQDPVPQENDQFGLSLAEFGNYLVIGEPHGESNGAVHLYDPRTAQLIHTYVNPEPDFTLFGIGVAALDNKILVGAPLDSSMGGSQGVVYVFAVVPEPNTAFLLTIACSLVTFVLRLRGRLEGPFG